MIIVVFLLCEIAFSLFHVVFLLSLIFFSSCEMEGGKYCSCKGKKLFF